MIACILKEFIKVVGFTFLLLTYTLYFFCLVVKLVYFLRTSLKLISKKNFFNIHVVWSQRWLSRLEHLPCMRMVGYSNHSRDIPDSLNVSVWLFVWLWSKTSVCLNGGIEPWSFAYKAIALPLSHRGGKQVLTGPRKTFGKICECHVSS